MDYVRVYSLPSAAPANLVWAPSSPQKIAAFSPSASQISMSWQPPASMFGAALTGYVLQRATDTAFAQNLTSWNLGNVGTFSTMTSAQAGSTYYYRVSAVSANGTSDPSAAIPSSTLAATANSKLLNISARGSVGTGSNVLIAGFVVGGPDSKTVLVRASGPALAAAPFNVPGTPPDPQLQML